MYPVSALAADLRRLGVPEAGILVVHSGYRSLGQIEEGPAGVVTALRLAVGPQGTLLAPTFTTNLVDPSTWPVPPSPDERQQILSSMELFDPAGSAPYKMGAIATTLWQTPGALRSLHPVTSWVALGPEAEALTREHPLDDPEGIEGPVGRAFRADAMVLLLGVGHDADTSIHLAESLLDMPHLYALPDRYPARAPSGKREWRAVLKTTKCSDGFVKLEPHLQAAGVIRRGRAAAADCQLLCARDIVRVAAELLAARPGELLCADPECVHCPTSAELLRGWQPAPGWRERVLEIG